MTTVITLKRFDRHGWERYGTKQDMRVWYGPCRWPGVRAMRYEMTRRSGELRSETAVTGTCMGQIDKEPPKKSGGTKGQFKFPIFQQPAPPSPLEPFHSARLLTCLQALDSHAHLNRHPYPQRDHLPPNRAPPPKKTTADLSTRPSSPSPPSPPSAHIEPCSPASASGARAPQPPRRASTAPSPSLLRRTCGRRRRNCDRGRSRRRRRLAQSRSTPSGPPSTASRTGRPSSPAATTAGCTTAARASPTARGA